MKTFSFASLPSPTSSGLVIKTKNGFKSFFKVGGFIIFLIIISAILHFWNLSRPHEIVFDELYFGSFVNNYFHQTQYFDIHPPLGKLMIAGTAKVSGFNGTNFDFKNIGEDYGGVPIFWLRFLPAIAGSLLPLIIFLFTLSLGGSLLVANAAAFLTVFDNALLMQSRFVFVDIFLLAFGFLGLTFFFWGVKNLNLKKKIILLFVSSIFFGLAISIKWTGLGFLAPALLYLVYDSFKYQRIILNTLAAILMGLVILSLYFSFFAIHFYILTPANHNVEFKSFYGVSFWQLENYAPFDFLKPLWRYMGEFLITNKEMFLANQSITAQHPYASMWLQWPLMQKPLYEWTKDTGQAGLLQRIYLIGNPFTWFLSTLSLFLLPLWFLKLFLERKKIPFTILFLTLLYLFNWLPFALIKRPMFIYHYLAALSIGLIILSFIFESLIEYLKDKKYQRWLIILFFAAFVIFSFYKILPLTYGLAVPDSWIFNALL